MFSFESIPRSINPSFNNSKKSQKFFDFTVVVEISPMNSPSVPTPSTSDHLPLYSGAMIELLTPLGSQL
jgi:hypothetical protein